MKEVKHALKENHRTTYLNYQNKRAQNSLRVKESVRVTGVECSRRFLS